MIWRFWNWFKLLFAAPDYYTFQMSMSNLEFENMNQFFKIHDNTEIEICYTGKNTFEIWKLVPAYDEYGERVYVAEEVGYYNIKSETFYYTFGFKSLLQIYNDQK
jgi:hypothetical protein